MAVQSSLDEAMAPAASATPTLPPTAPPPTAPRELWPTGAAATGRFERSPRRSRHEAAGGAAPPPPSVALPLPPSLSPSMPPSMPPSHRLPPTQDELPLSLLEEHALLRRALADAPNEEPPLLSPAGQAAAPPSLSSEPPSLGAVTGDVTGDVTGASNAPDGPPLLTARALRFRMLEQPAPASTDGFASLVDLAEVKQRQYDALDDPESGSGKLSFVGAAQAAARRRAEQQADGDRYEAQLQRRAGHEPRPAKPLTVLEPRAAKANLRKIEREEKRLFQREQQRQAEEAEALRTGVPPIKQRIAGLVEELDEPRPQPRDFDAEISAMLTRAETAPIRF